jgi:hypothetical protein
MATLPRRVPGLVFFTNYMHYSRDKIHQLLLLLDMQSHHSTPPDQLHIMGCCDNTHISSTHLVPDPH